jgi:ABC-type nitrate/sulfonate/bicarbonate transport system ATPase subunit
MPSLYNYYRDNALIAIENLNISFDTNVILRDVNLSVFDLHRTDVQQGQVVSILGPSGCGKTQLLKCISGLMKPTAGEILLTEERTPVSAGDVGFVFQHYPLMQHRTIMQNLRIAANNAGKPQTEIDKLLNEFGLFDKADLYPAQLSGGQRQRISIIQQILCSEHFLLMDEPFSGLDIVSKQKMMDLILQISLLHEHNTIIITTHDIEAAVAISDTIWVLGHEYKDNVLVPGATVLRVVDLIERGLTWNPDARHHPNFRPTCDELHDMFHTG